MTSDELYDLFRKDVVDTAKPYLWSDEEVYAYMNDAYYMFVRLMGGIVDSSSDVTRIDATAGEPFADIHESILTIQGAYRMSDRRKVDIINYQGIENIAIQDFGFTTPIKLDDSTGKIAAMVIGMEQDKVRWFKVPDADDTIQMSIYRLPIDPIVGGGQEFTNVKPHHHYHFLKWMRHLAYGKQDAETFDKKKSDKEEKAFEAYCNMARLEWERFKHKPRSIVYGGI